MEPRILLIAKHPTAGDPLSNKADAQISRLFKNIGVWVFGRERNAVWQVREQLQVAHAVLIVIERPSPSGNYPGNEAFELEVDEVLKSHKENPRLPVMIIIEHDAPVPPPLTKFPSLVFDDVISPPHLRQIVEFVFDAARPVADTPMPHVDLDLLIAKGNLELKRLKIIAEESGIAYQWFFLPLAVAIAGLALSIPGVLSRFRLSDYWLLVGPVIFIVGTLTTIYLFRRHTRGRRQNAIATLLTEELGKVLSELEHPKFKEPRLETVSPKNIQT